MAAENTPKEVGVTTLDRGKYVKYTKLALFWCPIANMCGMAFYFVFGIVAFKVAEWSLAPPPETSAALESASSWLFTSYIVMLSLFTIIFGLLQIVPLIGNKKETILLLALSAGIELGGVIAFALSSKDCFKASSRVHGSASFMLILGGIVAILILLLCVTIALASGFLLVLNITAKTKPQVVANTNLQGLPITSEK